MSRSILRLRPMQPDDLPTVMAIEERVFVGDAWSERTYRRDIANPNALYCILELAPASVDRLTSSPNAADALGVFGYSLASSVVVSSPSLLGYAGCWFIADEAHLMTIAIAPEWQGRGLGEWLLLGVLDLVEARGAVVCTLEVRVSNSSAQALYHKLGFAVAGRRRRYYQDNGEDALIMTTPALHTPAMHSLRQRRRQAVTERLAKLALP